MTDFTIQAQADGTSRLVVDGPLTIYNAVELKEQLISSVRGHSKLEMDLSCVAEVDTAGFQLLVLAKHESQRINHSLSITGHSDPVRELVDFYGMVGFFGDPVVIPATAEKE